MTSHSSIATMSIQELENAMAKIVSQLEKRGIDYAKKKSVFEQHEDFKKVVLADCTPTEKGSFSDRNNIALSSEEYKKHVESLCIAREMMLESQALYNGAQARFEAMRTILSNRREEIKRGL